jgi:hypothetical protein
MDNPSDPVADLPPTDPAASPIPSDASPSPAQDIPPPPPSAAPPPMLDAIPVAAAEQLPAPLPSESPAPAPLAASASVEASPSLPTPAEPVEEIPIAPPAELPPPAPVRAAPQFDTIPIGPAIEAPRPMPMAAEPQPVPIPAILLPRVSVSTPVPFADGGAHALPFWQRRWVQNGLPWATSVTVHLFILALALILVPPLAHALKDANREEVIVPDATLANDNDIGGVPNPGLGNDPSRSAAQENNADAEKGWAERKSRDLAQTLKVSAADNTLVPGQEKPTDKDVVLSPFGSAGDETANFGPRGGGADMGPRSKLFGHGGNVRSLIYVCDASGSMVGRGDDALKTELKRDIANLSPLQQFNVLIFHQMKDGSQYQRLADHLLMATPSAKAAAFDFVDRLPFSDVNNPLPALEEAFREQPQLIFLLSHGDFNNRYNTTTSAEVLAKINQLNVSKRVHVNTRLLLGDRSKEVEDRKDFEAIMNDIASENGGEYKKVYSDEL